MLQKNFSVGLTYTPWLKDLGLNDVYLLALAGYYKLDEDQALAGSVRYFSLGNIQFTDAAGNDFGSGRPREFGVDFGYTRKLSDKIGLGVALRYIHSNLAGNLAQSGTTYKPGSTVAGDISSSIMDWMKLVRAGTSALPLPTWAGRSVIRTMQPRRTISLPT